MLSVLLCTASCAGQDEGGPEPKVTHHGEGGAGAAAAAFGGSDSSSGPTSPDVRETGGTTDLPGGLDPVVGPDASGAPDIPPAEDGHDPGAKEDEGGEPPTWCGGAAKPIGCTCTEDSECASGPCVDGRVEDVCTEACVATCPNGWACAPLGEGGDDTAYCLPEDPWLCRPCMAHEDCRPGQGDGKELCMDLGTEGSFCGVSCTPGQGECPEGFRCEEVNAANAPAGAAQCVPDSGTCECSASARELGLATRCLALTDIGACEGLRRCGDDGLGPCEAVVDADRCLALCVEAACMPAGGRTSDDACVDAVRTGWCLIDGGCYPDGALQPGRPCMQCRASVSQSAWQLRDGEACDDGDPCTTGDSCWGSTCVGSRYACDDGLDCTVDKCVGDGSCEVEVLPGACLAEGLCRQPGAAHPENPCLACLPEASSEGWSPVEGDCDDGDPCTVLERCSDAACVGTRYDCDDGLDCTSDMCDGAGGCRNTPTRAWCAIGGECRTAGERDPENPCRACNPSGRTDAWSALDGGPCEDGNPCTESGVCSGGVCVAGAGADCDDGNPCTDDGCDPYAGCFHVYNNEPCDDGDPCSGPDTCQVGVCRGPSRCAAGETCAFGRCAPAGDSDLLYASGLESTHRPQVLAHPSGGFVVVYQAESNGKHALRALQYDRQSRRVKGPVDLRAASPGELVWSRGAAVDLAGELHVVFAEKRSDERGLDVMRITATHELAAGAPQLVPTAWDGNGDQTIPALTTLPAGLLVAMGSQEFLAATRVYECCQDCNCKTSPAVAQNLQLLVSFLRPSGTAAQNVDRICGPPYPCVGCGQCDFEHVERGHDQLAAESGGGANAFVAARVSTSDARSWIRLDAFAADGTRSGALQTEATALGAAHPALAVWPGERALLVWDQTAEDGSAHNVLGQGLDLDTVARGRPLRLNTHTEGSQQVPTVVALEEGALVVWESWWQDGDAGGIMARKVGFDTDGAVLPEGAEIQVNVATEGNQSQPSAARLSGGRVVVVWEHAGSSGQSQIRARILSL